MENPEVQLEQTHRGGLSQPHKGLLWLIPVSVVVLLIVALAISAYLNNREGPDVAADATDSAAAAADSTAAPEFELVVFGNENYTRGDVIGLSQFQGQPVVINFWYPSCPPCRLEMPHLEQSWKDHKEDGVQFIGVQLLGLDTIEEGQEFLDDFGITYAVGPDPDGKIIVDYAVRGFPSTAFLDKNHNLVSSWTGILNLEKLEELILEILP